MLLVQRRHPLLEPHRHRRLLLQLPTVRLQPAPVLGRERRRLLRPHEPRRLPRARQVPGRLWRLLQPRIRRHERQLDLQLLASQQRPRFGHLHIFDLQLGLELLLPGLVLELPSESSEPSAAAAAATLAAAFAAVAATLAAAAACPSMVDIQSIRVRR